MSVEVLDHKLAATSPHGIRRRAVVMQPNDCISKRSRILWFREEA